MGGDLELASGLAIAGCFAAAAAFVCALRLTYDAGRRTGVAAEKLNSDHYHALYLKYDAYYCREETRARALEADAEELRAKLAGVERQRDELVAKAGEDFRRCGDALRERDTCQSRYLALDAGYGKLQALHDEVREELTAMTANRDAYRAKAEGLEAENRKLESLRDEASRELAASRSLCRNLEINRDYYFGRYNEVREELTAVTADRDAYRAKASCVAVGQLLDQRARLLEVLKPVADAYSWPKVARTNDPVSLCLFGHELSLTVGDCRRAAAAYQDVLDGRPVPAPPAAPPADKLLSALRPFAEKWSATPAVAYVDAYVKVHADDCRKAADAVREYEAAARAELPA